MAWADSGGIDRTWIDISVPLATGMPHWPGDPEPIVTSTLLNMSPHTGTHIDAPLHYIPGATSIVAMPFSATVGEARVIEICDVNIIKPGELRFHEIQQAERILLKTRNSEECWPNPVFNKNYVSITPRAANYLVECGIRTIGIDYLSIGPPGKIGDETHQILLEAGIWIIEGLNLSMIEAGRYDLICLPLVLAGCDGAPARAVVRKIE
jgi:arylformamidase